MEFTRLADVEIVETANDTDKVLIEQNGEIKRVPKTEVGGTGGSGNTLILNLTMDQNTGEGALVSSSMTFEEALTAINNYEITGAVCHIDMGVQKMSATPMVFADATAMAGTPAIMFMVFTGDSTMIVIWTAEGVMFEF